MTITIGNFKTNFNSIEIEELTQITQEFSYSLDQQKESFTEQVRKIHIRCEQCDEICEENYCFSCEHYSTREKLIKTYQYRGFKVKVHELNQVKNVTTGLPKNPLQYRVFNRSGEFIEVIKSHEVDYEHKDIGILGYYPLKEYTKSSLKKIVKNTINDYLKPGLLDEVKSNYTKRQRRIIRKVYKCVVKYSNYINIPAISEDEQQITIGCREIARKCSYKEFKDVFDRYIKTSLLKSAFVEFKKALL